jgi:hypothetical protein
VLTDLAAGVLRSETVWEAMKANKLINDDFSHIIFLLS